MSSSRSNALRRSTITNECIIIHTVLTLLLVKILPSNLPNNRATNEKVIAGGCVDDCGGGEVNLCVRYLTFDAM